MAKKTTSSAPRKSRAKRPAAPPPEQELVEPAEEAEAPAEPADDGELVLDQEPVGKPRVRAGRVADPASLDDLGSAHHRPFSRS